MRNLSATVVQDGLEFKIEWSFPVSLSLEQIITGHLNLYLATNPTHTTELAYVSTALNGIILRMIDSGEIQEGARQGTLWSLVVAENNRKCTCWPRPRLDLCAKKNARVLEAAINPEIHSHEAVSGECMIRFLCPWCHKERLFRYEFDGGPVPLWLLGVRVDLKIGRMEWRV